MVLAYRSTTVHANKLFDHVCVKNRVGFQSGSTIYNLSNNLFERKDVVRLYVTFQ